MRRNWICLSLMGTLLVSLYLCIPVCAMDTECRGTTLPVIDSIDDVWNLTSPASPWDGTQGDYHDEVDMKSAAIVGDHLCIEFCAFPVRDADHQLRFYVDEDEDITIAEYYLIPIGDDGFIFRQEGSSVYWDGSSWVSYSANCTYSIDDFTLTIHNVSRAIPTLNISLITIVSSYYYNNHFYMDFIPCEPPEGGIPGFQYIYIAFCIITLMGIVVVHRRRSFTPPPFFNQPP